jgi:hypothetical protein
VNLDLGNDVIWMINTSSKTLEEKKKTHKTCKGPRHKMEPTEREDHEETSWKRI